MSSPRAGGSILAYGLPGLVTAIPIIPIAILLPTYYANELGLGLTVTGSALVAARLVDFFSDLLVGLGVDRGQFGRYRYKQWVVCGAVVGGLGLVNLAYPGDGVTPWSLMFWSIVLFTGWTMVMVPYTAWGAELSDDKHERSSIAASREVAGLVGMLSALALPVILPLFAPGISAAPLELIAMTTLVIGVPAIAIAMYRVPEPVSTCSDVRIRRADLIELLQFAPYRRTLLCWLINSFANGLPAVLFPIVVQQYFGFDERSLFLLLTIYFAAAVICAPLWLAAARRFSKLVAWVTAIGLNITVFAGVLLIDPTNPNVFYVVCLLTGATLAADLALPASIQADVMESDRAISGKRRTATAFALWSMATKLALALAIGVAFIGLGASGESFDPERPNAVIVLLVLYVCLPIISKLIVAALLVTSPGAPLRATPFDRDPAAQESQ